MMPAHHLQKPETGPWADPGCRAPGEEAIQRLLEQPLSPEDLREATERVARPLQPPEKQVLRLLAFQLHSQPFAVEARHVLKVTRAAQVHRIPHRSNAIIRGFCHLDGELLLCADLANLLELVAPHRPDAPEPPPADAVDCRRMIVLEDQSHAWAFQVDTVEGVTAVVSESLRPPPLTVDASWGHFTAKIVQLQHAAGGRTGSASCAERFSGGIVMSGDLSGFSLFELFKDEAESHAAALNDGLLAIESQPNDVTPVEGLMRAAHSVKGAARIVGLDPVVELAHAMEDCFVAVQRGTERLTSARVDQLLQGVDVFQELSKLDEPQLNDWLGSHRSVCEQLAVAVRQPPPPETSTRRCSRIVLARAGRCGGTAPRARATGGRHDRPDLGGGRSVDRRLHRLLRHLPPLQATRPALLPRSMRPPRRRQRRGPFRSAPAACITLCGWPASR